MSAVPVSKEATEMTIAIGDWVHHRPPASVPREQTVQRPMLVTEIDEGGWHTCTFEGMDYGAVHKFMASELAKVDPDKELAAAQEKSEAAKEAAGIEDPPPTEPITMKHSDIKVAPKAKP
jgi:hypothetical protein